MWSRNSTRIVLKNGYSLGDVVMLTAAVRDLHRLHPNRFLTEVRTSYPELWSHNPFITGFGSDRGTVRIDCDVPLIKRSNEEPWHYLHAIPEILTRKLHVPVHPTEFKGDIHLSHSERSWLSQIGELAGSEIPFWIIVSGGKFDITIKWWDHQRYQRVVDHFRNRIQFVQVGDLGNHHPKLNGTIDLRGQTELRQLIRLIYHSQGVLCPVTSLMHLAAAVPFKGGGTRPCVVVAGGREPAHWEAYPGHQFIHTIGTLPCCAKGGCWKDRTFPIGDSDRRDLPRNLCTRVSNGLPECMDRIRPESVIDHIESYLAGGRIQPLHSHQKPLARKAVAATRSNPFDQQCVHVLNAAPRAAEFLNHIPKPTRSYSGRGIVICAGGTRYFTNAYICASLLRAHGCTLPIQFWHIGPEELDDSMRALVRHLDVECIDGEQIGLREGLRPLGGWELKIVAVLHSPFRDVLFLDADNTPLRDPEFLFETPQWKTHGALFWPDYNVLDRSRPIWKFCGIEPSSEREFETGQFAVDKLRCWDALQLCLWYNDRSYFFYHHIHGDKETFLMAFRRTGKSFAQVPTPIYKLPGTMCQHDFHGQRIFQHRNLRKWALFGPNPHVPGFLIEDRCRSFLAELESRWDGFIQHPNAINHSFTFRPNTIDQDVFDSVVVHNEYRLPPRFTPTDAVLDIGAHIGSFSYACLARGCRTILAIEADPENAALARKNLAQFGQRVQVLHRAVWRSDQQPSLCKIPEFPPHVHGINTGGAGFSETINDPDASSGSVRTVSFDAILSSQPSWKWVKLDCEGSEWPILATSNQLHRIQNLSGEYHLTKPIPSSWQVPGVPRFDVKFLRDFLQLHFQIVKIRPIRNTLLGHFWASKPR